MKANPDFHTSIEQINNLIVYSKESGYHWEYILLSGGEPLLWKNLLPGAKLIYESGICSRLVVLTNGLAINPATLNLLGKLFHYIHEFRISRYHNNSENIRLAQEYFGEFKNDYIEPQLSVVDRTEHMIPPDKPVPDSLPAECTCKAFSMVGGEIHLCGPAWTIYCRFPTKFEKAKTEMSAYIADNDILWYRSDYEEMEKLKYNREYCRYCISNAKVARTLKKEGA
jgi:hypothetical protein